MALRPVKSEKEEVTWSNLAQDAGTARIDVVIVNAVDSPTTAGEIEIGDTVRSVYFEFHFSAQTTTNPKVIHWAIYKSPAALVGFNPNVYDQTTKKYILKRGMEMLPSQQSVVYKRQLVVRLPPRIRKFGDADRLTLSYICSSTEAINACGFAIFKHFG